MEYAEYYSTRWCNICGRRAKASDGGGVSKGFLILVPRPLRMGSVSYFACLRAKCCHARARVLQ
eukprot:4682036-Pyramimonas_sp.AAC.1